jgi:hypothetical protein
MHMHLNPEGVEEITLHGFLTKQSLLPLLQRLKASLKSCKLDQIGFGSKPYWDETLEALSQEGFDLHCLEMNMMFATSCAEESRRDAWIALIGNFQHPYTYRWKAWTGKLPPLTWSWKVTHVSRTPVRKSMAFEEEHKARMSWWSSSG